MDVKYLKNPIILGILGVVITYLYMWWEDEKRYKKYPNLKRKSIGLLTPLIVGGIVWFITSSYFTNNSSVSGGNKDIIEKVGIGIEKPPLVSQSYKLVNNLGSDLGPNSVGSKSYHLISKNKVKIPSADVFIDIAKF